MAQQQNQMDIPVGEWHLNNSGRVNLLVQLYQQQ